MKNIQFHTKKYKVAPGFIFHRAGYVKSNKSEWVKDDDTGRFHITGKGNYIFLHYDLLIENRHVVFSMPNKLKGEIKRIAKINYCFLKPKKEEVIKWKKPAKKKKPDTRLRIYK